MAELRWILLGLGLLLIGGIWWRGTRGTGQASKDANAHGSLRAGVLEAGELLGRAGGQSSGAASEPSFSEDLDTVSPGRERAVPPFEPLIIKTTDFDRLPIIDAPFIAETPAKPAEPEPEPEPATASATVPTPQKIVTIRICALGDARWSGKRLADALELQGLAFGRYQVFHRNHVDGRSMFCVASILEPGTFDQEAMPTQEFRGVIAFAVLPGPLEPVQTIEAMIATARRLAESLTGMVQDGSGQPLSPQRAAALREEVARFQATLP